MKIALIDNYDSFTFVISHYLSKKNCKITVLRNDQFNVNNLKKFDKIVISPGPGNPNDCLLYTSPSPRDGLLSRMPSSA